MNNLLIKTSLKIVKPLDKYLLKKRINHARRKRNLPSMTEKEYTRELLHYNELVQPNILKFTFIKDDFSRVLTATSQFDGYILCSQEWAVQLLSDKDSNNPFLITLGHEVSHKEQHFKVKKLKWQDKRFVNWSIEVFCDFNGAKLFVNSCRKDLINSCIYKLKFKKRFADTASHPSWIRRIEYATNYDFNEKLIARIAHDTKCNNKNLIDAVTKFYQNRYIQLYPFK